MNQVFFSWFEALDGFAADLGLSYDDLTYCLYNEILSRKIPSVKTLENRKKDFVAFLSHGQIGIVSGKQVNKFKKLCSEKNIGNSLAGSIAFSGFSKGRVRIISQPKDLDNFKKGEVLVASMTTPSMVMAMKKASAFVTDEGGITCHAAILAREMKKPCVIGTKNATRLLKNGDFVEVDADKGIVRIIKK